MTAKIKYNQWFVCGHLSKDKIWPDLERQKENCSVFLFAGFHHF
jgi:hypothetical protein